MLYLWESSQIKIINRDRDIARQLDITTGIKYIVNQRTQE